MSNKEYPLTMIYFKGKDKKIHAITTGDVQEDLTIIKNQEDARAAIADSDCDISNRTPVLTLLQMY